MLLGTPPNQITVEEKKKRLAELEAKHDACYDGEKKQFHPGKLDEWIETNKEMILLDYHYPDKPDPNWVKPTIVNLVQTCGACPSQWDAKTIDDKEVYIRYRSGYLSLEINNECVCSLQLDAENFISGPKPELIEMMSKFIPNYPGDDLTNRVVASFDGTRTTEQMQEDLKEWVDFKV